MILVKNVSKTYRNSSVKAVDNLSFEVKAGECYGLLGPNGAGKTTMMKILYGVSRADPGQSDISVFGFHPHRDELNVKALSGVVPQDDTIDQEINVRQNLAIYARFYGMSMSDADSRIDELLEFMELSGKKKAGIRALSGGMKRRLVIARALLNRPSLLFLDEPTTGLDPQVRHLIWDKLRSLKRQGMTIMLTTHYMDEAFQMCDNLTIMDTGKKVIEGHPQTLISGNIEKFVLEIIKKEQFELLDLDQSDSSIRLDISGDISRIYSNDDTRLHTLTHKLTPGEYYFRQSNLEDVFLKTTGRDLNAQQ